MDRRRRKKNTWTFLYYGEVAWCNCYIKKNKQTKKKLLHLKSWENKDNIRVGTEYLMKNALSSPASNAMGICFVSLKV